ncbi:MAG: DUF6580 family putative transport protein [Verrucomicrobiia bacterium]
MIWLAMLLIVLVAGFRVFTGTHEGYLNVAPLMAMAFCGGIYLRGRVRWVLPLGALLVSDMILNRYHGVGLLEPFMIGTYACYGLAVALGAWVATRKSMGLIFGGVLANAVVFYAVTNTLAWLFNPLYAKTIAGWWQAVTVGLAGFPPTYLFFRNSLVSDLIFTACFVLCMEWGARTAGQASRIRGQEPGPARV